MNGVFSRRESGKGVSAAGICGRCFLGAGSIINSHGRANNHGAEFVANYPAQHRSALRERGGRNSKNQDSRREQTKYFRYLHHQILFVIKRKRRQGADLLLSSLISGL